MAKQKQKQTEIQDNESLNTKVRLLEQAVEAYKKSSASLEWATKIIVALFAVIFALFSGFIAYTIFKDHQEYKRAVDSAKGAAAEAREWNEKAAVQYSQIETLLNTARVNANQWSEEAKKQYMEFTDALKSQLEVTTRRREEQIREMKDLTASTLGEIRTEGMRTVSEVVRQGEQKLRESEAEGNRQRMISDLWSKGRRDWMAGDFEGAASCWERVLKLEPNDSRALANWGSDLSKIGLRKGGDEADKYSTLACEKYRASLRIDPNNLFALLDFRLELGLQAGRRKEEEADKFFDEAYSKCEEAHRVSPLDSNVLITWGSLLTEQAKTKKGSKADELLEKACEKYRLALDINPGDRWSPLLWGCALSIQATSKKGEEAVGLYRKAYEKFEKAQRAGSSTQYETLVAWATTLISESGSKDFGEGEDLLSQACDKCLTAFAFDPNQVKALYTWGDALVCWGGRVGSEGKHEYAIYLLDNASSKLEMAAAKQPCAEYFERWGDALGMKAMAERSVHVERTGDVKVLMDQACQKYEMAVALDPHSSRGWENWGRTLFLKALGEKGTIRETLLSEAKERCLSAESVRKGSAAVILASIGDVRGDEYECRKWLQIAEEAETLPSRDSPEKKIMSRHFGHKDWFKRLTWKKK